MLLTKFCTSNNCNDNLTQKFFNKVYGNQQ